MKRFTLALAAALVGFADVASASKPVSPPPPAATLTNTGCPLGALLNVTVVSCSGFWSGNLLNRDAGQLTDADEDLGLAALGYGPKTVIQKIGSIADGSQFINFTAPLFGQTLVAFHWGNGVFNANWPNYNGSGGGTAFYLINAGNLAGGLDKLELSPQMRQSISNATLYMTGTYDVDGGSTGQSQVVPEPATMTLLATGLAGMAFATRRRRKQS